MLTERPFDARDLLALRTEALAEAPQGPERALMRAVLEDALSCAVNPKPMTGSVRNKQSKLSAQEWIACDELAWPFSFLNICTALGYDPGGVRRWVTQMETNKQRLQQRPRNQGRRPGIGGQL